MTALRRVLGPACALVLVLGLAAVGGADRWSPAAEREAPAAPEVTAVPTSLTLACPGGFTDPYTLGASSEKASAWTSTGPVGGGQAPTTVTATATGSHLDVPSGVVIAGQGGGELRGLSLTACTQPSTDQWLAVGSTEVGEDLVLVLSNPSQVPSIVTVSEVGATGASATAAQTVTVPAGQVIAVMPAGWFADESRPALHIRADGPGVSAWMQTSGLDGETPTGATWAPTTRPGTHLVIPGVSGATTASLRIAVPGDAAAHVKVSVMGEAGTTALPGGELDVDASTTLDLDLAGIPRTASTLVVDANEPVVAQVTMHEDGKAYGSGSGTWSARWVASPSVALTQVEVPARDTVLGLADTQLRAAPLRATSQDSASGSGELTATLVLADAGTGGASVQVGDTSVTVPAGGSVNIELPAGASTLSASSPVHAALVVTAQTPTGPLGGVWPLGSSGIASLSARVDVQP